MKTNKIKYFFTLILILISTRNFAESYQTGIGFRLGGISSGITVKHFISSPSALEGILSFGGYTFLITGLYEKHSEIPNAEGLTWFYGGGGHLGFFNNDHGYDDFYYYHHTHSNSYNDHSDNKVSLGLDFILGLDYKFKNAPINISADVKPFVDIIPGFYGYWEGALSFRFTL